MTKLSNNELNGNQNKLLNGLEEVAYRMSFPNENFEFFSPIQSNVGV